MNRILHRAGLPGVIGVLALVIGLSGGLQAQASAPAPTVQKFKEYLDQGAVESICRLMAEHDRSGPLSAKNYDAMRTSMENLVPLWRGESFAYGSISVDESKLPARATINVKILRLKQDARFTLLRFGTLWYIADIEIFFK